MKCLWVERGMRCKVFISLTHKTYCIMIHWELLWELMYVLLRQQRCQCALAHHHFRGNRLPFQLLPEVWWTSQSPTERNRAQKVPISEVWPLCAREHMLPERSGRQSHFYWENTIVFRGWSGKYYTELMKTSMVISSPEGYQRCFWAKHKKAHLFRTEDKRNDLLDMWLHASCPYLKINHPSRVNGIF